MSMNVQLVRQVGINRERLYESLGERIRQERSARAMKQAELAARVGLSRTSITNVECGRQALSLHQLVEFAFALGVEPTDLMPAVNEVREKRDQIYSTELLELVSKLKHRTS
ncbi:MAG: helix-turn-helix transcriptional regulator [Sphingomonas sp.]|nr:helix-turn-helix transcriptional regulator [Sphingomonas sp.]